MSLKDKTIVVTGGSRGLGLGLVEALVDQGAKMGHSRLSSVLQCVRQRMPPDIGDPFTAAPLDHKMGPEHFESSLTPASMAHYLFAAVSSARACTLPPSTRLTGGLRIT
jgi:NAD(P)-dependent dehydrogenase (short-subunit alcohol dehydrogenase family)